MNVKEYILSVKKELNKVIHNSECVRYKNLLNSVSKKIADTFVDIQNIELLDTDEEKAEALSMLNLEMEELVKKSKEEKQAYKDYITGLNVRFKNFEKNYPMIFEKFITDEVDNDILMNCLNTYTLVENGTIDLERAKEMGYNKYHKKE